MERGMGKRNRRRKDLPWTTTTSEPDGALFDLGEERIGREEREEFGSW